MKWKLIQIMFIIACLAQEATDKFYDFSYDLFLRAGKEPK